MICVDDGRQQWSELR